MSELDLAALLSQYGPWAAVALWLGWRMERLLLRLTRAIDAQTHAIIALLERQGHPEVGAALRRELERTNGQ